MCDFNKNQWNKGKKPLENGFWENLSPLTLAILRQLAQKQKLTWAGLRLFRDVKSAA